MYYTHNDFLNLSLAVWTLDQNELFGTCTLQWSHLYNLWSLLYYLSSSSANYLEEPFYLVLLVLFWEGFVMAYFLLLIRITEPGLALLGLQFLDWNFKIAYCYLKSWKCSFFNKWLGILSEYFLPDSIKTVKGYGAILYVILINVFHLQILLGNGVSLYSATLTLQMSLLLMYAVCIAICALLMFWPLGLCLR